MVCPLRASNMNRDELIERYFKDRRQKDKHFGGYPFLTISRQAGAGGHTLAETLLAKLDGHGYSDPCRGWKLFDRELCEEVSAQPDLHVSVQSLLTEDYRSEMADFLRQVMGRDTPQTVVYRRLFEIQRTLSTVGKVILVGRGASFATRNMRAGIRVRLTAPIEVRQDAMMRILDVDHEQATKAVARHDQERARFVKTLFNHDINDLTLYDEAWDTSKTSIDIIADAILERIKAKAEEVGRT